MGSPHIDRLLSFWAKVEIAGPDDCWVFTGWKNQRGYGRIGGRVGGPGEYAHRFSWVLANKMDPGAMIVCHKCDNPPCVNPAHLFLGTQKDNMADMRRKSRQGPCYLPPNPPGELAYRAKLKQCEVDEIRRLYSLGVGRMLIAKMFPIVRYQQIYRIISGSDWR